MSLKLFGSAMLNATFEPSGDSATSTQSACSPKLDTRAPDRPNHVS